MTFQAAIAFALLLIVVFAFGAEAFLSRIDARRLRSSSFYGFLAGTALLVIGAPLALMGSLAGLAMHQPNPRVGETAALFGCVCLLVGLMFSIFSVISGILVRVKHGQSCPWPVMSALVWLTAISSVITWFMGKMQGWF